MAKAAQELIVELGEAINDYIAESTQIRAKISEIKAAGYDVVITFDANVVLLPEGGTSGAGNLVN